MSLAFLFIFFFHPVNAPGNLQKPSWKKSHRAKLLGDKQATTKLQTDQRGWDRKLVRRSIQRCSWWKWGQDLLHQLSSGHLGSCPEANHGLGSVLTGVQKCQKLVVWFLLYFLVICLLLLFNPNEPHHLEATFEDLSKTEKLLGTSWMPLLGWPAYFPMYSCSLSINSAKIVID